MDVLYDRIKTLRAVKKISQEDLAEKMGYTNRSIISKIEAGQVDLPESKIQAAAKALNTTPEYLMGWSDDPNDYETIVINNGWSIPADFAPDIQDNYDRCKAYCKFKDAEFSDGIVSACYNDPMPEEIRIIGRAAKDMSEDDRKRMLDLFKLAFRDKFKDE